jgi:DNA mismatch repair protein MutL
VVDVLGNDLRNSLYPIELNHGGISISGWTSSPRAARRTSRGIFIYVNGRFVRDRTIQHALFEGYTQRLVKGQFPVAVVTISLPFDQVDVNVHPTKNEVRFVRQRDVHEAVRRAVAQTLYEKDRPAWSSEHSSGSKIVHQQGRVSEAVPKDLGFGISDFGKKSASDYGPSHPAARTSRSSTRGPSFPKSKSEIPDPKSLASQSSIWKKKQFSGMRVIGQFHNTYIVCESDAGLILIDQHAAHERVLYEQYSARAAGPRASAQRLLVPETVELGYREAGVLEKIIPELKDIGLDIEPFGGNTFVVKAVPVLLAGREIKPVLIEIVETIAGIGASPGLDAAVDQSRMVMACHAAIRANQALSEAQIKGLLNQLDDCHNPSHCPHGRPTWIHWDLRSLDKSFKRIV